MLAGFGWIAGGPGVGMQSKDIDFMKRKGDIAIPFGIE